MTICNQKGGTSKSTSVVNLGAALQLMGKKVLIVDMDPQGDASTYLGYDDENADTISQMIERFIRGEQIDLHDIIQVSEKNGGVEYIPADLSLAGAEMYLVSVMSRETVLRRLLSTIRCACAERTCGGRRSNYPGTDSGVFTQGSESHNGYYRTGSGNH